MKYTYDSKIKLHIEPESWNKNSGKEILQYAVGSLLYMPATTTKIANEIITKRYSCLKSMVLCLEDSIGDDMVRRAEESVVEIATQLKTALESNLITIDELPLIFIRVREQGQMKHLYSLLKDNMSIFTGFVIPKFDMYNCKQYIEEFMEIAENLGDNFYMLPIIESKNAMYRQLRMNNLIKINSELKLISNHVLNIRVGAADFCNIYGIRRDINSTVHDINVVADCLADIMNVFGRNYVVSSGVWEYFGNDRNGAWAIGLKEELRLDKLNGFIGKTCIHPTQLPIVQEHLIVDYENYRDAVSILGMAQGLQGVAKGYGTSKMNESKTHGNWAKKVLGLASIYGVKAEA